MAPSILQRDFVVNICFCFLKIPVQQYFPTEVPISGIKYLNTNVCVSSSYLYTFNVLRSVVLGHSVCNAVMVRSFAGLEASERRRLFCSCWESIHDPSLQCVDYPGLRKYLGTYMCKGKGLSLNMPCRHRRRVEA
jgi:hypothetical protein